MKNDLRNDFIKFIKYQRILSNKRKFVFWSFVSAGSFFLLLGYDFGCGFAKNNFPFGIVLFLLFSVFMSVVYGSRFNSPIKLIVK